MIHTPHDKNHLSLWMCVYVCVSVWTQASEVPLVMHSEICPVAARLNSCSLSSKALAHLLLPFLSRCIFLFLSVSLFAFFISNLVLFVGSCSCPSIDSIKESTWTTPLRPLYVIQTSKHNSFSSLPVIHLFPASMERFPFIVCFHLMYIIELFFFFILRFCLKTSEVWV